MKSTTRPVVKPMRDEIVALDELLSHKPTYGFGWVAAGGLIAAAVWLLSQYL